MNFFGNDKTSSNGNSSEVKTTSPIPVSPVRINPVLPGQQSGVTLPEDKSFFDRAKAFEPACLSIVKLIDNTAYKSLLRKATKVLSDEDKAEEICSSVRLSTESLTAAKQAGARIFARHCESTEAADYAVLAGVACEMTMGYLDCLNELRKIAQYTRRQAAPMPKIKDPDDE